MFHWNKHNIAIALGSLLISKTCSYLLWRRLQQGACYVLQFQYALPWGYSPSLRRSLQVFERFQQRFSAPVINMVKLDLTKSNSFTYPQRKLFHQSPEKHLQNQHFHQQSLQINLTFHHWVADYASIQKNILHWRLEYYWTIAAFTDTRFLIGCFTCFSSSVLE